MSRNRDIIFLYLWCKYCGISDPKLGLKFKYLEHSSQLKIECWMNLQVFLREFFLLHGFEAFVNSQLLECRETVSALCLSTTNSVTKNALRSSSAFWSYQLKSAQASFFFFLIVYWFYFPIKTFWSVFNPSFPENYFQFLDLSFFFHFSFIIHMCIQGLGHFSPLPPPPPLPPTPPPPSLPHPLNTQQKLFCPYF
jgi:hypothetical protein